CGSARVRILTMYRVPQNPTNLTNVKETLVALPYRVDTSRNQGRIYKRRDQSRLSQPIPIPFFGSRASPAHHASTKLKSAAAVSRVWMTLKYILPAPGSKLTTTSLK